MSWFGRRHRKPGDPEPGPEPQAAGELLDQYHPRASISDGDQLLIVPGKVLENIAFAMERVDIDIDTAVSIEGDVAPVDELVSMVENLRLGPTLAVHVANTAMRIMSARYPEELVRTPLPPSTACASCSRSRSPISSTRPRRRSSTGGPPALRT
jgi:hypothetical protein